MHRGVYALAEEAEIAYLHARKVIAGHLNVNADEIIFVRGTTEALNLVAQSYARAHLGEGDVVLLTTMEHHANIVPWQLLKEQTGIEIEVSPILEDGSLDRDALSASARSAKSKASLALPRFQLARHGQPPLPKSLRKPRNVASSP